MLNINMKDETYQRALKDGLVLVKGIFPAEGLNQDTCAGAGPVEGYDRIAASAGS